MAAGRSGADKVAESCILLHRQRGREILGPEYAFETSDLILSDTLPPRRSHLPALLILSKNFNPWGLDIQAYEPMGAILIQTITFTSWPQQASSKNAVSSIQSP